MRDLSFSALADQDIEELLLHSLLSWGPEQMEQYERGLYRAFSRLQQFPLLGKVREELEGDVRVIRYRHHLIVYTVVANGVPVLRVLHERQSLDSSALR